MLILLGDARWISHTGAGLLVPVVDCRPAKTYTLSGLFGLQIAVVLALWRVGARHGLVWRGCVLFAISHPPVVI